MEDDVEPAADAEGGDVCPPLEVDVGEAAEVGVVTDPEDGGGSPERGGEAGDGGVACEGLPVGDAVVALGIVEGEGDEGVGLEVGADEDGGAHATRGGVGKDDDRVVVAHGREDDALEEGLLEVEPGGHLLRGETEERLGASVRRLGVG